MNIIDLNKHISENYKSKYDFAKKKNISPQLVQYWCSKEWYKLGYKTREKIKTIININ